MDEAAATGDGGVPPGLIRHYLKILKTPIAAWLPACERGDDDLPP
jgi:hypothetical protein